MYADNWSYAAPLFEGSTARPTLPSDGPLNEDGIFAHPLLEMALDLHVRLGIHLYV